MGRKLDVKDIVVNENLEEFVMLLGKMEDVYTDFDEEDEEDYYEEEEDYDDDEEDEEEVIKIYKQGNVIVIAHEFYIFI